MICRNSVNVSPGGGRLGSVSQNHPPVAAARPFSGVMSARSCGFTSGVGGPGVVAGMRLGHRNRRRSEYFVSVHDVCVRPGSVRSHTHSGTPTRGRSRPHGPSCDPHLPPHRSPRARRPGQGRRSPAGRTPCRGSHGHRVRGAGAGRFAPRPRARPQRVGSARAGTAGARPRCAPAGRAGERAARGEAVGRARPRSRARPGHMGPGPRSAAGRSPVVPGRGGRRRAGAGACRRHGARRRRTAHRARRARGAAGQGLRGGPPHRRLRARAGGGCARVVGAGTVRGGAARAGLGRVRVGVRGGAGGVRGRAFRK